MKRLTVTTIFFCLVSVFFAPVAAQQLTQGLELEPLSILRKDGTEVSFQVEVARTGTERAKGLMYRRHLDAGKGMLFDFRRDAPVSMWMKNTFIPLDMLFIRKDGVIARIVSNTTPFDLTPIPSGEPVRAVLELAAGRAEALGLKAGQKVDHVIFAK